MRKRFANQDEYDMAYRTLEKVVDKYFKHIDDLKGFTDQLIN